MGKFRIRKLSTGYKFDLFAANGKPIASSEVYTTLAACRKGLESVVKSAEGAGLEDLTAQDIGCANPKFQLYRDKAENFRFRLRSRNGKIVAVSAPYTTHSACLAGIESVKSNVRDARIVTEES